MFFYQFPTLERFVKQIRKIAHLGLWREKKAGSPILVFMSAVIRANPKRAARRCRALAVLPAEDRGYPGWACNKAVVPASEAALPGRCASPPLTSACISTPRGMIPPQRFPPPPWS